MERCQHVFRLKSKGRHWQAQPNVGTMTAKGMLAANRQPQNETQGMGL